jgi:phospholipid transport system substrate-binding protein
VKKYKRMTLIWLQFLLCLSVSSPLSAGTPTDQIRVTVEKVRTILKRQAPVSAAGRNKLQKKLHQIIYPRFDFVEKAKRSLGSHWRQRTPEEQQEFVKLFADYLTRSFLFQIESHKDELFFYTREKQDDDYAEVDSKIITKKGNEFSINYRLHLLNKDWKIYDIVIENVSVINNYRSQFHRIITNDSYEELLRRMKDRPVEGEAKEIDEAKLRAIRGWMIMSLFSKSSKSK